MEITTEESEAMAFLGEEQVICKIIVDYECLQVKNFKYLGCETSYENEKDIQQNTAQCSQILRILNNTFKLTSVQKFSKIKVFNALALPILLFGSEIWTLRQNG